MSKSKFSLLAAAAVAAIVLVLSCQKTDLTDIETDINTAKININNMQNTLDRLEMFVDLMYSEVSDTSYIQSLRERIDTLQQRVDKATVRIDNLCYSFESQMLPMLEELAGLSDDIEELRSEVESRFAALEDFADSVRKMVRSVVFVPRHTGGCAVVKTSSDLRSFTLDYEIFPEECAEAIAAAWIHDQDILSLHYRDVSVRSGLPVIRITGVNFNKESKLLEVTVELKTTAFTLVSGGAVAVSLNINTGIATVASPFTDIIMPQFVDLSAAGTANCYIVNDAGDYKFKAAVKGNGKTPDANDVAYFADADTAVVLWESFGSTSEFAAGALVNGVVLDKDPDGDGYTDDNCVLFTATSLKGNAVIAVKDSKGDILWSWHIWLTDAPEKQVYANDADVMMDRNLGATSAEKGNPRTLGLLYQWGRKDPFLGSSDISKYSMARSVPDDCWKTVEGPKTLDESAMMPTTFISGNDWTSPNDNLWMCAADSAKTIYDPCPVGWRVPYGGNNGVWKNGIIYEHDSSNKGVDFARAKTYKLGVGIIWYPFAGESGMETNRTMDYGACWSCTPYAQSGNAYAFFFSTANIACYNTFSRAKGLSVRCIAE